jgi:Rrf2 family protein
VESRRGAQGGYSLAVAPDQITVADIVELIDGSFAPVKCILGEEETRCKLNGRCVFAGLWRRAQSALTAVYEGTTLQDLVNEEAASPATQNYCI